MQVFHDFTYGLTWKFKKQKGKLELLMLVVGAVFFVIGLLIDLDHCYQLGSKGETWWCVFSSLLIFVSLVCINIMAGKGVKEEMTVICTVLLLGMVILPRYKKEFDHWKSTYWDNPLCGGDSASGECEDSSCGRCVPHKDKKKELDKSAHDFAWIRCTEALTKSAPQLCLKAYIMLCQQDFSTYTCLPVAISLLSLAWTMTVLKEKEQTKNSHDFGFKRTVLFFIVLLPILSWRLSVVVWFMYVFKLHVFTLLAIHAVLVNVIFFKRTGTWSEWNVYTSIISFLGFPFSFRSTDISESVNDNYRAGLASFMCKETLIMTMLVALDFHAIVIGFIATIIGTIAHVYNIYHITANFDPDGGIRYIFVGVVLGITIVFRIISGNAISFGEIIATIIDGIIREITTFISIFFFQLIDYIIMKVLIF